MCCLFHRGSMGIICSIIPFETKKNQPIIGPTIHFNKTRIDERKPHSLFFCDHKKSHPNKKKTQKQLFLFVTFFRISSIHLMIFIFFLGGGGSHAIFGSTAREETKKTEKCLKKKRTRRPHNVVSGAPTATRRCVARRRRIFFKKNFHFFFETNFPISYFIRWLIRSRC